MKELGEALLLQFGELVSRRLGLCFQKEHRETFRSAVLQQVKSRSFTEPSAYFEFLVSDAGERGPAWRALILMLTTCETYFFRDRGVFSLLRNTLLPELIERNRTRRSLRIWCAGCATGEEPFSIAMLLDLLLPDPKAWDIAILGTDINEQALARAEEGIYSIWSFRLMDSDLRDTYFKHQHNGWKIADSLRKMVSFQYGNVLEAGQVSLRGSVGDFDLLLCRNVFIYFEREAVARVMLGFRDLLASEGMLLTGHAELYGHELAGLRQTMYPETMVYKKENQPETPELSLPPAGRPKPERPASLLPRSAVAPLGSGMVGQSRRFTVGPAASDGEVNNRDLLQMRAQAHANAGNYAEAQLLCRRVISIDADSPDPFFLLAHVAEAVGNNEEAKQFLKKAIYLQPSFVAAYCELGSLYDKENDEVRARKVRNSALVFLRELPSDAKVAPYEITAGDLHLHLVKLTAPGRAAW